MENRTRIEHLTRQAPIAFRGTVVRTGVSTVAALPATAESAVVRVDQVLRGPTLFRGYGGREITILSRSEAPATEGEQAIFFAEGLHYGESIALREIDREPIDGEPEAMSRAVAETADRLPDETLQRRIATSDVVVVGRVTGVTPMTGRSPRTLAAGGDAQFISEHNPNWHEATVAVEGVERGQLTGNVVTVIFPASRDIYWHRSPKFQPGDSGVFLLHRGETPEAAVAAGIIPEDYTALDPLDFQPIERQSRIRELSEALG